MPAPVLPVRLEHDPNAAGECRLYDDRCELVSVVDGRASVFADGSYTRFSTWAEGAAVRDRLNAEGAWDLSSRFARKKS